MKLSKEQKDTLTKAKESLDAAYADIESIRGELSEEFDEKSDNWKESTAGETFQEVVERLSEAMSNTDDARDRLNEVLAA